jgi:hypothetical protein
MHGHRIADILGALTLIADSQLEDIGSLSILTNLTSFAWPNPGDCISSVQGVDLMLAGCQHLKSWELRSVATRVGQNRICTPYMSRVGQNRISAPYMTVCMVISLLKYRMYTVYT